MKLERDWGRLRGAGKRRILSDDDVRTIRETAWAGNWDLLAYRYGVTRQYLMMVARGERRAG